MYNDINIYIYTKYVCGVAKVVKQIFTMAFFNQLKLTQQLPQRTTSERKPEAEAPA